MNNVKKFLALIPIPICGLLLGLVSLGNVWANQGAILLGTVFSSLGLLGLLVMVVKFVFLFRHSFAALDNPIVASVSPTFTMAWMVACVFLQRIFPHAKWIAVLWFLAVGLHFALMLLFCAVYLFPVKVEMEQIYPSWFITFVGMGVIPNTAHLFAESFGSWLIWFTLATYFVLLPLILWRVLVVRKMHESTWPLITIIAAPGSLCLAGYLASIPNKQLLFVLVLFVLSQCLYLAILSVLPKLVRVPFYPSYAAFTFPLVISATAALASASYFKTEGIAGAHWVSLLGRVELFLATLMVSYVFIRYSWFLVQAWRTLKQPPQKNEDY